MTADDRTTIILRQYPDGQVIALMPDDIDYPDRGHVMSYMHLGQHGAADYLHVIATTRPAGYSPEVIALKAELKAIGYDAKYRQRRDRRNRR